MVRMAVQAVNIEICFLCVHSWKSYVYCACALHWSEKDITAQMLNIPFFKLHFLHHLYTGVSSIHNQTSTYFSLWWIRKHHPECGIVAYLAGDWDLWVRKSVADVGDLRVGESLEDVEGLGSTHLSQVLESLDPGHLSPMSGGLGPWDIPRRLLERDPGIRVNFHCSFGGAASASSVRLLKAAL